METKFKTRIRTMSNTSKSYAVIIPNDYFQSLPSGLPYFDSATITYDGIELKLNNTRISKRPSTRYFAIKKDEVDGKIPLNTVVDVRVRY